MADFKCEKATDTGNPDLSTSDTKSADQKNRFPFPLLNHISMGLIFTPNSLAHEITLVCSQVC